MARASCGVRALRIYGRGALRGAGGEHADAAPLAAAPFRAVLPVGASGGSAAPFCALPRGGRGQCEAILLDWNNRQGLEVIDNRLNELSSWQDKQLNKWFREKGKDWWGLDEEASAKVEKIIEKSSKQKEKPQSKAQKSNAPICPCCGKPLVKKQRLVLD